MLSDEFRRWEARVVEVAREHHLALRCPVRDRELLDGPEERIRQALLHFFVELARTVPFVLGAERERHDIDLRWPTSQEFKPVVAPMLIVETKVDGAAGDTTNAQLERYLRETAADCGVVFTGARMWRLTLASSNERSLAPMHSLDDLANLVRARAALDPLALARTDFAAASAGEIGCLRRLAERYPYATFVLSVGGREVACRHLRFSEDSIQYRPAGRYTHRPTRIPMRDVGALLRLEG